MQVLKIQDLQNLPEFSGRTSESSPPFFAVFGKPINHSLSPKMQNAALAEMAKTDSFYNGSKYFAFEVDPSDLKVAIESLYSKNFVGINLTIPHKEVIMGIIDDFDPHAKLIGACNTLLRTKNGWKGYNTDGFGLERAVEIGLGGFAITDHDSVFGCDEIQELSKKYNVNVISGMELSTYYKGEPVHIVCVIFKTHRM